jgi:DNA-binding NarL/FixJ family response regulator
MNASGCGPSTDRRAVDMTELTPRLHRFNTCRALAPYPYCWSMNVLIIEDHKLVSDMLVLSCRGFMPTATFTLAENGTRGMEYFRKLRAELVFLDLVLPDCDGLDLVRDLLALAPQTKIIALTAFPDEFTIHRLLEAKVPGLIAKNDEPLDHLAQAVESVMDGGQYFSPVVRKMKASIRSDPDSFAKVLSEHEQKLLGLFGEGLTNEAVATLVGLSASTVKAHRRNILGKLGLHGTPELIHYALEKGFTRVGRHRGASG